jgi:hypothetical protein
VIPDEGAQTKAAKLADEIREHKRAIRQHRAELGQKKAALDAIERRLALLGVKLHIAE